MVRNFGNWLTAVKVPCDESLFLGLVLGRETVYINTPDFNCVGALFEIVGVEIVRPKCPALGFYRVSSIENEPDFRNSVVINTGSDNVKVARNTHVVDRVCY